MNLRLIESHHQKEKVHPKFKDTAKAHWQIVARTAGKALNQVCRVQGGCFGKIKLPGEKGQ